ncbi:MAG: DUF131 domain-containing protein [Desulfurococcales archaeon]|nr:DUF131 domain-containing protein [Desulfurococcales archaeon]
MRLVKYNNSLENINSARPMIPLTVFIAIVILVIGLLLIFLGMLYLISRSGLSRNEKEEKPKTESIGFILIGPIPVILRGRGEKLWPFLLPITVVMLIVIVTIMIYFTLLNS